MRNYAQIQLEIWNNSGFRALSGNAQRLFFVLLSLPSLNHAGVGDWRPKRLAKLCSDWTVDDVEEAAGELIHGLFILIDEETEEFLIRSFVRNDPLMKQPNMATAMAKKLAEVGSNELRGVVVFELKRLRVDDPSLPGWKSKSAQNLLNQVSVDPSVYPLGDGSVKGSEKGSVKGSVNPLGNPSGKGSSEGSENPLGTPLSKGSVKGSEKGCPTPAPTPNTYTPAPIDLVETSSTPTQDDPAVADSNESTPEPEPPKQPRGTYLPEDWEPSPEAWAKMAAKHPGVDIGRETERFKNYWLAASGQNARKRDWTRAWYNWLDRATPVAQVHRPARARNTVEAWLGHPQQPTQQGGVIDV
ncbi:hypothetical protein HW450_06520 [Corynebacterium hindlerae]|uniref:Uncharacterized protein n=1 Tax=Corynebacterium hindlerae TaxID=699041 RepID=A0A7G5FIA4_9CORY|nr:hypothetical protein [Corynebacterium hindlerae]QMV86345.1 hypothetical protein HW450_06520 [Corynebacterium hindlerae]